MENDTIDDKFIDYGDPPRYVLVCYLRGLGDRYLILGKDGKNRLLCRRYTCNTRDVNGVMHPGLDGDLCRLYWDDIKDYRLTRIEG